MILNTAYLIEGNTITICDNTLYENISSRYDWYSKEDCASVFVLEYYYHTGNKYEVIQYDSSPITLPKDGYFIIHHLVLPTKTYCESIRNPGNKSALFCIEGDSLYQLVQGVWKSKKINELLISNIDVSNVYIESQEFISTHNLHECLLNICMDIFNNLNAFAKCFNSKGIDEELKYKRDILWMALYVIEYLIKHQMLREAGRIINQLTGCNGICNGQKSSTGCGCSRT